MTITATTFTLAIIAAVIIGIVGTVLIYRFFDRLTDRISLLEKDLTDLQLEKQYREQVLLDAAKRGRKHHSYATAEGLEDAMAVMIEAAMNLEAEQARVQTALGILQEVRKGPHAYTPEKRSEK